MPYNSDAVSFILKAVTSYIVNAVEVLRFGGLQTDEETSPFEIVSHRPMFRLRRYFARENYAKPCPPVVLVPPLMITADVWDVSPSTSAVAALHAAGMDPWVVDFGAPDLEDGGLERTLTDHVVAVSEAIDLVATATGRSVHLAGYSQGGMFCYQAAAYRRSRDLSSVITFGSPIDWHKNAPFGVPEKLAVVVAHVVADYVFRDRSLPGWLASAGFRLLDPLSTARSQVRFLRQLHDRESLLGKERQRRFLAGEGFVAWSGPAIVDMMRQVVIQNRMMTGGFVVGNHVVSLGDVNCPILTVMGDADGIGVPGGVRKVAHVTPAATVYELVVARAGHFGLVVGSTAKDTTWPGVVGWVQWLEGNSNCPDGLTRVGSDVSSEPTRPKATLLATEGATRVLGFGFNAVRGFGHLAVDTLQSTWAVGAEAVQTAPRMVRLGQIQSRTRISFAKVITERAKTQPDDACFLFSDRVHTYADVDTRITNVVKGLISVGVHQGDQIGILMDSRPSALIAIAALSRLGAVAVLLPPSLDLPKLLVLVAVTEVVVDPEHVATVINAGARSLVLGGGGGNRDLPFDLGPDIVDLESINPNGVDLPRWYRPDPGTAADLAFVVFTRPLGGWQPKFITNHRWALSAFGTASAGRLSSASTVYCLSPLHHPSGLLTALGGAVAGGARIALSTGFDPKTFDDEVRRYGVTVVAYTWAMLRELICHPTQPENTLETIKMFMGSGMPRGVWRRVQDRYPQARILELYAVTEFDVMLANLSAAKMGSCGRPLPGTAEVELVALDPCTGDALVGKDGFAIRSGIDEPGLLLTKPGLGIDASVPRLRGMFRRGDAWVSTDDVFRRDRDGDYWMLSPSSHVIYTRHGSVYPNEVADALTDLPGVDLAVVYAVPGADGEVAVAAISEWESGAICAADVSGALASVASASRPDIVHVVDFIPLTNWYRPDAKDLAARGLPKVGRQTWFRGGYSKNYFPLTKIIRDSL